MYYLVQYIPSHHSLVARCAFICCMHRSPTCCVVLVVVVVVVMIFHCLCFTEKGYIERRKQRKKRSIRTRNLQGAPLCFLATDIINVIMCGQAGACRARNLSPKATLSISMFVCWLLVPDIPPHTVNFPGERGVSPLHEDSRAGSPRRVVSLLVRRGATVEAKNSRGR